MTSGKVNPVKGNILKEQNIPTLIIWVPIISIIITAVVISLLFIAGFNNFLEKESENLSFRLLEEGKHEIKKEVTEVINYIDYNKKNSEKWLQDELKSRIDMAYSIIESIYEYNYKNKSHEEIIDIIRETLRNVRFFDNRGYYFIHRFDLDSNDFTILQPNLPSLEGNFQLEEIDLDGKKISESAYNLLESEGEGFLSFSFYLNDQNRKEKKLAYMKLFKPLNIFLGTGEYLYYFEENIKSDVLLWLESYEYKDGNYIFVYDNTGKLIMHPISSELVGKNMADLTDSNDYNFGQEYLQSIGNKAGVYVSYKWLNPETNSDITKIGYALSYDDWGWNVGTGLYMNSLEDMVVVRQNNLKNRLKTVTLRTIVIVGILIIGSFIITFVFARFTVSLFSQYNQHIRDATDKLKNLNLSLEKKVRSKTKELEKKNSELEQIATVDSLTDIYNRRYFDFIFNKEWYRHMRNNKEISLIMCDIDFFKQYNDAYGHQKGDDCLKIVGNIIKKTCKRPTDIPVRYGGEEFALILPQTNLDGAITIARDLQNEIIAHNIIHECSSISKMLTFSFGVSSVIPEKGKDYAFLLKLADDALYRAKANGRNRIES